MNISPVAKRLIDAIESYIEETSKKEYRFTFEEQQLLCAYITKLNKQVDVLIDYEIRRERENIKDAE